MFERFTERARQIVVLAQDEARALGHNYIGTEHLLLGLLREEDALPAGVLRSHDVALEAARTQVRSIVGSGDEVTSGQIPFTPRAKRVLELALREALSLGHNYIGTEHILLGLLREGEGVAVRVLLNLEVDPEALRADMITMLGPSLMTEGARAPEAGLHVAWSPGVRRLLMSAAAHALEDGRTKVELDDLRRALEQLPPD